MANTTVEYEGVRFRAVDNGDGTFAISTSGGGGGAGVSSLNTLTGALTIAAGAGITVTPSGGNTLTIAASGGSTSFSALTSGTNTTAAMIVGTGASLVSVPQFKIGAVGTAGVLGLLGSTSGTATFTAPAVAGVGNGVTLNDSLVIGNSTSDNIYVAGGVTFGTVGGASLTSYNGVLNSNGTLAVNSAGGYLWSSATNIVVGTIDTGLSRLSAGVVSVDTSSIGNSLGTIQAAKAIVAVGSTSSGGFQFSGCASCGLSVASSTQLQINNGASGITRFFSNGTDLIDMTSSGLQPNVNQGAILGAVGNAWSNTVTAALTVGVAGTLSGVISLAGSTSGTATITAPAVAGVSTNALLISNVLAIPLGTQTSLALQVGSTTQGLYAVGGGLVVQGGGALFFAVNSSASSSWTMVSPGGEFQPGSDNAVPIGDTTHRVSNLFLGGTAIWGTGAANDTGLSRVSAGVVGVGNGTAADVSGTLNLTTLNASGVATFSGAGAASASPVTMTGVPFSGTGTTSTPLVYINTTGSVQPTTWGTSGTLFGANAASGFSGNFIDMRVNGGASVIFSVSSSGAMAIANGLTLGGGFTVRWSARSGIISPADGNLELVNAASTSFTRLQFGGTTSSFAALCLSGTTITSCLADGTAGSTFGAVTFNATGLSTFSFAGAASTPSVTFTGTVFTGGSGTTTFPNIYANYGAAPTTWSTSGTIIGINAPSGFGGNFLDCHLNGGTSVFSVSSAGVGTFNGNVKAANYLFTNLLLASTAPTISSGFNATSPSIASNNGAATFRINTGTGTAASSGVVGLPTAANGWNCNAYNLTAHASNRADDTIVTSTNTTTATLQNQTKSTGAATVWTASDVIVVSCFAY